MKRQNIIRSFAGALVLVSALLGYFAAKEWLFIAMFVGANLFQYGFTNWCLLEKILIKAGIRD